jgi:hypothetical protein
MKNQLLKTLTLTILLAVEVLAFEDGNGTAVAPWVITTTAHLNTVRNNLTAHYRLANDIDLGSTSEWIPIGNAAQEFQGTFDGGGYTVRGVKIENNESKQGFFGVIGASGIVKNLGIEVDIVGNKAGALAAINWGTIENCMVSGFVAGVAVGGMLAENRGTVKNSHSSVATQRFDIPVLTTIPSNPTNGQAAALRISGNWGRVFIELVYVAPGSFYFGRDLLDDINGTSRNIAQGFWIGKYPITQAQYQAVMTGHPRLSATPSIFNSRPNNPVEMVSFNDITSADGFLARVGGRLPDEFEWEFAARGGNLTQNFRFAGSNNADEVAWHAGNSHAGNSAQPVGLDSMFCFDFCHSTQPVGGLAPNELGLYDMSGNVFEGTSTVRESGVHSLVYRGGAWFFSAVVGCRVTFREFGLSEDRSPVYGFRVVFNSH